MSKTVWLFLLGLAGFYILSRKRGVVVLASGEPVSTDTVPVLEASGYGLGLVATSGSGLASGGLVGKGVLPVPPLGQVPASFALPPHLVVPLPAQEPSHTPIVTATAHSNPVTTPKPPTVSRSTYLAPITHTRGQRL